MISTSPATSRSTKQGCDPARLASYLAVGVAGAMMATDRSDAAIVMIDLTNVNGNDITGANPSATVSNWLGLVGGGTLVLGGSGLSGQSGLEFAVLDATSPASPRNFGAGDSIGAGLSPAIIFSGNYNQTNFDVYVSGPTSGSYVTSPDFGANSFMGFRFGSAGNYNYGYLEVTWSSSLATFQIFSGAYESTVNQAILAGATGGGGAAAVPVPAASLLALMALGGNSFRRSRTRAA